MAKKLDRFGWERERGTAAHDRAVMDWVMALRDYPLAEIQAACRAHVLAEPGRMPNEGHIVARIMEARRAHVAALPKIEAGTPERDKVSTEIANEILARAGYPVRRF